MKSAAVLASALLTFACFSSIAPRHAAAQPSLTPPLAPAPLPPPSDDSGRDPMVATALAVAPVLIGGGLAFAAGDADGGDDAAILAWLSYGTLTLGPSLGHYYAGATGRGLATSGVRLGATALGVAGVVVALESGCIYSEGCERDEAGEAAGYAMMLGGAALYVGATVYDILDAAPAARRHNRGLTVLPTALPTAHGPAAGLALGGTF